MFNFRKLLTTEFLSLQNVPVLFTSYGFDAPEGAAVEKWHQRNSIPGVWLAAMLALLELERGQPISLAKYMGR